MGPPPPAGVLPGILRVFPHPLAQVSPVPEQVMVVVAADSSAPTAQGPVHTGGVDGAAVDHRAGHPG